MDGGELFRCSIWARCEVEIEDVTFSGIQYDWLSSSLKYKQAGPE